MPPVIPPAGVTPLGFFVPQTFADPKGPPAILADAIDPHTREYLSISKGADPVDAQVVDALAIVRGSGAAVTADGQDFASIRKIDDSTVGLIEGEAKRALARLLAAGDIEFVKLAGAADDDWSEVYVQYRNLRAHDRRRVRSARVLP
jgi:hypothetical protein